LTGIGWERVLTASDLPSVADVDAGTVTGQMLSWDQPGTAWEVSARAFELSDGFQIRGTLNNDPAVSGQLQDPRLEFANSSGQAVGEIDWGGTDDMLIRNIQRNGLLSLRATQTGGNIRNILVADPDLHVEIHDPQAGIPSIATQLYTFEFWSSGGSVLDASGVMRPIMPVVNDRSFSASFQIANTDLYTGHVCLSGTNTVTLPINSNTMPRGSYLYLYNTSGNNLTVSDSPSSVSLVWVGNEGNASSGNRTIADNGWCRLWKRSSAFWYIIGQGIS
jgi:hypothetical protein